MVAVKIIKKKSITKQYISYDSICRKCPELMMPKDRN